MNGSENRRSFVRHDDDVLLRLRKLDAESLRAMTERLGNWRLRYSPGNELLPDRRQLLPAFRKIQATMPEVAAYLAHLERRIETLSGTAEGGATGGASTPSRVNLSATGLRCEADGELLEGDAVEVGLVLLPDCEEVAAIGRVIRVEPDEEDAPGFVSIHFDHILERDEETLIRHVHRLQRELLMKRRLAA